MTNKDRDLTDTVPTDPTGDTPTTAFSAAGTSGAGDATETGTSSPAPVIGRDAAVAGPADTGAGTAETATAPGAAGHDVRGTAAGSTWVGLIVGAVILILLLVFILQNGESVRLHMFVWQWNFPIGVGMLIAAVAGALIAACVGTVRIFQLRRQVKKGD